MDVSMICSNWPVGDWRRYLNDSGVGERLLTRDRNVLSVHLKEHRHTNKPTEHLFQCFSYCTKTFRVICSFKQTTVGLIINDCVEMLETRDETERKRQWGLKRGAVISLSWNNRRAKPGGDEIQGRKDGWMDGLRKMGKTCWDLRWCQSAADGSESWFVYTALHSCRPVSVGNWESERERNGKRERARGFECSMKAAVRQCLATPFKKDSWLHLQWLQQHISAFWFRTSFYGTTLL